MTATFVEALFGLMEIIWLMVIAGFLLFSAPIWVVPYTIYKVLKQINKPKEKNNG